MSRSFALMAVRTVDSGRTLALLVALVALTALPSGAYAQRPDFRGSRGGGGDSDRAEQMRSFFSQMRSGNASSDDRRQQMQQFFSRMREQQGGQRGGERGGERGSSRGGSRGGSREGGDRSRGRSSSPKTKPKPKVRATFDLPEQYTAQDLDNDGQLGLYEWKLSLITQFRTLDTNGDGFLTPRELSVAAPAEETATASTGDTGDSTKSSEKKSESVPSTTVNVSTKSAPSGSKKDAGTVRYAKYAFKSLDKDKDGKLTAEEWGKSKRTRERFTKAKVQLKLPVDEAGFVAAFPPRS